MNNLAHRMSSIHDASSNSAQPTAIFGSIGSLPSSIQRQTKFRVATWPLITTNTDAIEEVMGISVVLGYLLQLSRDIRVYFLPAQLEDSEEEFDWSPEKSQFTPDTWDIEELDENVALWGNYTQSDGQVKLTIYVENDLAVEAEEEEQKLELSANNLSELLSKLPSFASLIIEMLDADLVESFAKILTFDSVPDDVGEMRQLCKNLFKWELNKYLFMADFNWDDDAVLKDYDGLIGSVSNYDSDFPAWCVSQAMTQLMNPGLSLLGDLMVSKIDDFLKQCNYQPVAVITLADGLFRLGQVDQSYQLIENRLEDENSPQVWAKLSQLYAESGRVDEAIGVLQDALQGNIRSEEIYRTYGNLLSIAEQYNIVIDEVVLVNSSDDEADTLILESVAAYDRVLKNNPDDLEIIHRQVLQLLSLEEMPSNKVWSLFAKLVVKDETGNRVRDVLDALEFAEDIEPAIELLESASKRFSSRLDLLLNLAVAYRLNEDYDLAEDMLSKAQEFELSEFEKTDIEAILLTIRLPEFEHQFSELVAMLSAGKTAKTEDVDFLEDILEIAPSYVDAYVWLSRSYLSWDDADAALEVLLDGDKEYPNRPAICELIAELLWDSGERKLAFEYLNRGLETDPNHIPLLSRTAIYLVENGQYVDAKMYLARAEMINPRNAAFIRARNIVAQTFAEDTDMEKNK